LRVDGAAADHAGFESPGVALVGDIIGGRDPNLGTFAASHVFSVDTATDQG
jgi:hypothetical protein